GLRRHAPTEEVKPSLTSRRRVRHFGQPDVGIDPRSVTRNDRAVERPYQRIYGHTTLWLRVAGVGMLFSAPVLFSTSARDSSRSTPAGDDPHARLFIGAVLPRWRLSVLMDVLFRT